MKLQFSAPKNLPEGLPTRIQLFHPGPNNSSRGTVNFNPELIPVILNSQLMKDGRDLYPIDIDHERGASLGWFKLLVDETGIYADEIEWTKKGKEHLENREFRFYSPTFFTDLKCEYGTDRTAITQIDCFALTNSPALYNLTPIVASKENIMSEQTSTEEVVQELSSDEVEIVVEEPEVELAQEEVIVDEKDKLVSDLQAQNEALQNKLAEALAKLDEIAAAEIEDEKEEVLSSIEMSSDEKAFFKKLSLDSIKEYSAIVMSKKKVVEEVVAPIEVEVKEFANKQQLSKSVIKSESKVTSLPSLEQIQARASQIAGVRNKV